jgi:hypothetical protein
MVVIMRVVVRMIMIVVMSGHAGSSRSQPGGNSLPPVDR